MQTDFTYFKIIGWGCLGFGMMPRIMRRQRYLSTILDDYSRYIIRRSHAPPEHGLRLIMEALHQHVHQ